VTRGSEVGRDALPPLHLSYREGQTRIEHRVEGMPANRVCRSCLLSIVHDVADELEPMGSEEWIDRDNDCILTG